MLTIHVELMKYGTFGAGIFLETKDIFLADVIGKSIYP
jgi:hypothetical protein